MESPALFWLMIVTFGIVLVLAAVDLLKTKGTGRPLESKPLGWDHPQTTGLTRSS